MVVSYMALTFCDANPWTSGDCGKRCRVELF